MLNPPPARFDPTLSDLGQIDGEPNVIHDPFASHDPVSSDQSAGSQPSSDPTPIGADDAPSPEPRTLEGRRRARRQRWGDAVARVAFALDAYKRTLRSASIKTHARRTTQRLQRLARRTRAAAISLRRVAATAEVELDSGGAPQTPDPRPAVKPGDNQIGALAACMRANRRVYLAAERALDARPPRKLARKLQRIKNGAVQEAGTLNAHIGELCVVADEPVRT